MPNTLDIADARKVLNELKKEIASSEEETSEKEELAGLLEIVVKMPDLIREKENIDKAITKNRHLMEDAQRKLADKTKEVDKRMSAIENELVSAETNLTKAQANSRAKIKEAREDSADEVNRIKASAEAEKADIRVKVKDEIKLLEKAKGETDTIKAELRQFKVKVAEMNV